MREEGVERGYVDGVGRRDAERLRGNRAELQVESLQKKILERRSKDKPTRKSYAFNNARADSGYRALDSLVARRAHHQRAPRFNGRQQRVTVFQTMLQLAAYFDDFVNKPSQLSVLYCVRVNWLMQLGVAKMAGLPCCVVAESAVLLATLEARRRET